MQMTLREAWADFVFGLHQTGKWETLSRKERQYLDKTNREVRRGAMPLGKVRGLFDNYAPGVYTFTDVVFWKNG